MKKKKLSTKEKEYRSKHYWIDDVGDIEIGSESKTEIKGFPIFISRVDDESDVLLIRMRATGDGMVGDYREEIYPGDKAFGYTYEELLNNLGELIVNV